jgi:hypothetical protein
MVGILDKIGEEPRYCPLLQALIHPGLFVVFNSEEKERTIGRLIGWGDDSHLMVIEYVQIEESTFHEKCVPIVEGFETGIPELVRMEKALFVEPVEIVEMAFVFGSRGSQERVCHRAWHQINFCMPLQREPR